NAVDGLLPLTGGSLVLDGRAITAPGPDRALVFQQPSLLPWRTVLGNVIYGVELRGAITGAEARERAQRHIELVGLKGFEDSFPSELSGGMQQRVNLARALTTDPEVLLLDEPFGALDAQTRETMQLELLRIWLEMRKTVLMVTHDVNEAVYLSNRICVMSARPGRIVEEFTVNLDRTGTRGAIGLTDE